MTSYGVQGSPVTISDTPRPPAEPVDYAAAVAPVHIEPERVEPVAPPIEADPETLSLTEAVDRLLRAEAALRRALALVTVFEHTAETTLLRSDYQRGQRDATLGCSGSLRDALGEFAR